MAGRLEDKESKDWDSNGRRITKRRGHPGEKRLKETIIHSCPICGEEFEQHHLFVRHVDHHESIVCKNADQIVAKLESAPHFTCPFCLYESGRYKNYSGHIVRNHSSPILCRGCGTPFYREFNLVSHLDVCEQERRQKEEKERNQGKKTGGLGKDNGEDLNKAGTGGQLFIGGPVPRPAINWKPEALNSVTYELEPGEIPRDWTTKLEENNL